jgi:transcription elongation factor GreA
MIFAGAASLRRRFQPKSEQEINEARIAELEGKLARAEVIDVSKLSGEPIKFGATVSLIEEDTGVKKVR